MKFWKRGGYAEEAEELLFRAWTVIANARADWINPSEVDQEWVKAAKQWRDDWNKHLRRQHPRLNSDSPENPPPAKKEPTSRMTTYSHSSIFGSTRVQYTPVSPATWTTTLTAPVKEIVIVYHNLGPNGAVEAESPQIPGWRVVGKSLEETRTVARDAVADMYANGKLSPEK